MFVLHVLNLATGATMAVNCPTLRDRIVVSVALNRDPQLLLWNEDRA